jgi:biopolymer transport protein ExbB
MIELLRSGGVVMIPLLLASTIAVAVVFERLYSLRQARVVRPEIAAVLEAARDEEGVATVLEICRRYPGPFARIVCACLDVRHMPPAEARETVADVGRREVHEIRRGLPVLETVAGVAPLLGLLGTVFGMIRVFRLMAAGGIGQAEVLSGGISEALVTTAAGLLVAIPAFVAHSYFASKAEDLIVEIEERVNRFLRQLGRQRVDAGK